MAKVRLQGEVGEIRENRLFSERITRGGRGSQKNLMIGEKREILKDGRARSERESRLSSA